MSFRRLLVALAGSSLLLSAAACSSSSDDPGSGGRGGATGSTTGGAGGSGNTGGRGGSGSGGSASGGTTGGSTGGSSGGAGGASGGTGGSGGSTGGSGGSAGATGGAGGSGGAGGAAGGAGGAAGGRDGGTTPDSAAGGSGGGPRFSFFVTSLEAMRRLSKNQNGFGGDLRYGQPDGLSGADKICTELAETSLPGSGAKGWRAFLSSPMGPGGAPVHAIDRVGEGPWYDRRERLVAMTKADLLFARPRGADPAIINDLPNENGIPNHRPDPGMPAVDNHHFLTGSTTMGRLYQGESTCVGWTSSARTSGRPRIGFSWPIANRQHWISGQDEGGCAPGVNIFGSGGSDPSNPIVGSGGGYGGIYCFALKP